MAQMTEEELRKLSPEQLRELQKQNCIFCHIISKKVQSRVIYEDDKALAILDINPANPGHVLLLPKEHHMVSPHMPDELTAHLGMLAKQLSAAQMRALGSEGTSIVLANGVTAGQRASHLMLHVIPRKAGDGIGITLPPPEMAAEKLDAALDEMQRQLAPVVAKVFGTEVATVPSVRKDVIVPPPPPPKPATPSPNKKGEDVPGEKEHEDDEEDEKETEERDAADKKKESQQPQKSPPKKLGKDATIDDIAALLLGGKR